MFVMNRFVGALRNSLTRRLLALNIIHILELIHTNLHRTFVSEVKLRFANLQSSWHCTAKDPVTKAL